MGNTANLSDVGANAEANALAALLNAGTIEFYSGTMPANANTGLSGNTLLATATFSNPAFGAASGGVITAATITGGTVVATGTATFARLYKSDGTTVVLDCMVGISSAGIIVNTTGFVIGSALGFTSLLFNVTEM